MWAQDGMGLGWWSELLHHPSRDERPRRLNSQFFLWQLGFPSIWSHRGISSELWSSICHGVTAVCKVPFSSWRIYPVNTQPRHFLNMIKDKRSLTDAPPAPFLNGLIVLPWTAQLFPKAALVLPDLCSEATKKQSLGLSGCGLVDTKLSSSLLFCGLNTPASQHSPWAHKPNILPFSLAASLKKNAISYRFSKLMKQNQFYRT